MRLLPLLLILFVAGCDGSEPEPTGPISVSFEVVEQGWRIGTDRAASCPGGEPWDDARGNGCAFPLPGVGPGYASATASFEWDTRGERFPLPGTLATFGDRTITAGFAIGEGEAIIYFKDATPSGGTLGGTFTVTVTP